MLVVLGSHPLQLEAKSLRLHSPRNENAKNDARSSEIKISLGNEGGIDQTWRGKIIGAATLA
jgi:hypothetical protein